MGKVNKMKEILLKKKSAEQIMVNKIRLIL